MRRKPSMPAAFITNGFPIALRTNGSPCHLIPLPPFGRKDTKSLKVGIRASQRSSSMIPPKTSSKVVSIVDHRTGARPLPERRGSLSAAFESFQRLDLDNRRPEIVADPEGWRIRRVVNIHTADVRRSRQEVLDSLAGPGVHAHDVIVVHAARPGGASLG